MKKTPIIIGILIFVLTTAWVMSIDVSERKKVAIKGQDLSLKNDDMAQIAGKNVNLNSTGTNFNKTDINASGTNVNVTNSDIKMNGTEFDNTKTDINFEPFDNQSTGVNSQNTSSDNQDGYYSNFDEFKNRKDKLNNARTQFSQTNTNNSRQNTDRYIVKNIDWATWKSEFINKILDDSMYIHSLDQYGIGTWFYYSFTVTSDGQIRNINVTSVYLSNEDKKRIENLIRSYQYQDITVFPANSKRKTAKVDAVVLLGESEKKSKPSDFNDIERIKINLPN